MNRRSFFDETTGNDSCERHNGSYIIGMYPVDRIQKTVSRRHKKDEAARVQTSYFFTIVYKNTGSLSAGWRSETGMPYAVIYARVRSKVLRSPSIWVRS